MEPLHLRLVRDRLGADTTLGLLHVEGQPGVQPFHTCEDVDRGVDQDDGDAGVREVKVPGRTAIPLGEYSVAWTFSPRYAAVMRTTYGRLDGHMPQVLDVPGFRGIRFHSGNHHRHTEGCILLGEQRDESTGWVLRSRDACRRFYALLRRAEKEGRPIRLTIERAG